MCNTIIDVRFSTLTILSQMKKIQFIFLWCLLFIACTASEAQTVYITRTGAKYHAGDCRYLHSSKIPIALKEARDRGYTACSVCRPGVIDSNDDETAQDITAGSSDQPPAAAPAASGTAVKQTTTTTTSTSSSGQCTAITKAGSRCKRSASGGGRCWQHQ